jgi:hypothetical protein
VGIERFGAVSKRTHFENQRLSLSHSQCYNPTFASSPGDGRSVPDINGAAGVGVGVDAAAPPNEAGEKEAGNA